MNHFLYEIKCWNMGCFNDQYYDKAIHLGQSDRKLLIICSMDLIVKYAGGHYTYNFNRINKYCNQNN